MRRAHPVARGPDSSRPLVRAWRSSLKGPHRPRPVRSWIPRCCSHRAAAQGGGGFRGAAGCTAEPGRGEGRHLPGAVQLGRQGSRGSPPAPEHPWLVFSCVCPVHSLSPAQPGVSHLRARTAAPEATRAQGPVLGPMALSAAPKLVTLAPMPAQPTAPGTEPGTPQGHSLCMSWGPRLSHPPPSRVFPFPQASVLLLKIPDAIVLYFI